MKKLTICCDFDDTLNTLLPTWIDWLNNKYNLSVNVDQIDTWYIDKIYPMLTDEQIYEPLNSPEFWLTVQEKPGAIEYLKKLIEDGHDVYICTASYYKNLGFKFDNCLFRLFPFIDHTRVITTYNKQMISCDIMIDDAVHNIMGRYLGILVDMPHNKAFDDKKSTCIERAYSWKHIYELIHEIAVYT